MSAIKWGDGYYNWGSKTFVANYPSTYVYQNIDILDGLNIKLSGIIEAWAKYQKINTCITVQKKIKTLSADNLAQGYYVWDSLGESFENDGF